jgi:hypothetical protein
MLAAACVRPRRPAAAPFIAARLDDPRVMFGEPSSWVLERFAPRDPAPALTKPAPRADRPERLVPRLLGLEPFLDHVREAQGAHGCPRRRRRGQRRRASRGASRRRGHRQPPWRHDGAEGTGRRVGLHKQIANRIVEPWMFITVLVTTPLFGKRPYTCISTCPILICTRFLERFLQLSRRSRNWIV